MCQHEQTTFMCIGIQVNIWGFFFKLATTTTFVCVTVETKFEFLTVIIIILYVHTIFFKTNIALPESVRDLRIRPPMRTKMEDLIAQPPVQVQAKER